MKTSAKSGVSLSEMGGISLKGTFECGQCFRFDREGEGYTGVAFGRAVHFYESDGLLKYDCSDEDFETHFRQYFDLERDYGEIIARAMELDPRLIPALEFGRGIRILRQEPFEALCSFIISQCNNIPRIKGIISKLCVAFGDPFEKNGRIFYAFPSPERLASLSLQELDVLRAGYRAPYLLSAARAVCEGTLDLENLRELPYMEARSALTALRGVGIKVADCALLFGLSQMDAFPVDTHIKRALEQVYPGGVDTSLFPGYAGIIQQYIFYYMLMGGGRK